MLLITGITGFVGNVLQRELREREIRFRCLARGRQPPPQISGGEVVVGDLLDQDGLLPLTRGVNTVIHLAARIQSADPAEIMEVNVRGTENLVAACIRNGVSKIIYISSLDAVLDKSGAYGKSKARAEEIVRKSNIGYTILRPAFIYGRDARNLAALTRVIRSFPIFPVPGSGRARLQPVHVRDLCAVILKLIRDQARNRAYCIAGEERISMNDLIDRIAGCFSKRVWKVHIPPGLLWLLWQLRRFLPSGSAPSWQSLRLLNRDKICDIGDARQDLGFAPISLDEGLRRVFSSAGSPGEPGGGSGQDRRETD